VSARTKRDSFDARYVKNFCPHRLSAFEFSPSVGASGGLITIWNNNMFDGVMVSFNGYSITVKLTKLSGMLFHVTNNYGPSVSAEKAAFIAWLYNLDILSFDDWIILGDFNLIKSPSDRNRPGGNINEMMLFNDLINHLDLVDISFQGRKFTWSNMQQDPLLQKLDWVFTSSS
jgi:hypothetical protein